MAYVVDEECPVCEILTRHVNRKCVICDERKERERIVQWNSQPADIKMEDLRKRIEKLEQGPARY